MPIRKIVAVPNRETLVLEGNVRIFSDHDTDCCEWHWLDFEEANRDGSLLGLALDLDGLWFRKVPGYGIELIPAGAGHPVRIPGYNSNNGYYGDNLALVVAYGDGRPDVVIDVTECQA